MLKLQTSKVGLVAGDSEPSTRSPSAVAWRLWSEHLDLTDKAVIPATPLTWERRVSEVAWGLAAGGIEGDGMVQGQEGGQMWC